MAAPKKQAPDTPPVRTPAKMGTQGPESGPSGNATVDADAPGAMAPPAVSAGDEKAVKADEKAQAAAANTKSDRVVKVEAIKRGHIGHKIREVGDVFFLELDAGQTLPSWVKAAAADAPTSPLSHSSEAKEEVVDSAGSGHTPGSKAETKV